MKLTESLLHPRHPERICWGCDRLCAADALGCANGSIRTPHPSELFGEDWLEWEQRERAVETPTPGGARPPAPPPRSGS